jgi:hypothetical protein
MKCSNQNQIKYKKNGLLRKKRIGENPRNERRVHKNENRTWRDRVAKANSYQRYQRVKDIVRYAGEDVD